MGGFKLVTVRIVFMLGVFITKSFLSLLLGVVHAPQ